MHLRRVPLAGRSPVAWHPQRRLANRLPTEGSGQWDLSSPLGARCRWSCLTRGSG